MPCRTRTSSVSTSPSASMIQCPSRSTIRQARCAPAFSMMIVIMVPNSTSRSSLPAMASAVFSTERRSKPREIPLTLTSRSAVWSTSTASGFNQCGYCPSRWAVIAPAPQRRYRAWASRRYSWAILSLPRSCQKRPYSSLARASSWVNSFCLAPAMARS